MSVMHVTRYLWGMGEEGGGGMAWSLEGEELVHTPHCVHYLPALSPCSSIRPSFCVSLKVLDLLCSSEFVSGGCV